MATGGESLPVCLSYLVIKFVLTACGWMSVTTVLINVCPAWTYHHSEIKACKVHFSWWGSACRCCCCSGLLKCKWQYLGDKVAKFCDKTWTTCCFCGIWITQHRTWTTVGNWYWNNADRAATTGKKLRRGSGEGGGEWGWGWRDTPAQRNVRRSPLSRSPMFATYAINWMNYRQTFHASGRTRRPLWSASWKPGWITRSRTQSSLWMDSVVRSDWTGTLWVAWRDTGWAVCVF